MPFPFTFKLAVPDLFNPFAVHHEPPKFLPSPSNSNLLTVGSYPETLQSPASSRPLKRAWGPSSSNPSSRAVITPTISEGYLDTPAKYRSQKSTSDFGPGGDMDGYEDIVREREEELMEIDQERPLKRRRTGIVSSIASTALSAALIGTAVGLTVYRLWRDRGTHPEQQQQLLLQDAPPPPYSSHQRPDVPLPTIRSPKKRRQPASHHTHTTRRRRPIPSFQVPPSSYPSRSFGSTPPPESIASASTHTLVQPEPEEEEDERMDYISGTLSKLIAEGKKALGKEVVVSGDDDVDDQDEGWVDEDKLMDDRGSRRKKRRGSMRLRPPQDPRFDFSSASRQASPVRRPTLLDPIAISQPPSYTTPSSPTQATFSVSSSSVRSLASLAAKEDSSSWTSDVMRESMERARARYYASRET